MSQIIFKYPHNIFFMLIPIGVFMFLLLGSKKKNQIINALGLKGNSGMELLKNIFMGLGLFMITIGLMGPQMKDGTIQISKESLDIYVLLDTSKSMLVEDVAPNRLEREKKIVEELLNNLKGDRVGFIPFSSSPYIQMPLTDDYNMAKLFLEVVDTEMIGGGGSDVGAAIELAYESFERSTKGDKVILIISDGEEHQAKSEKALKSIDDPGLKVYAIGVGSNKGGLIPVYGSDGQVAEYKKDDQGNPVQSKLNDSALKNLAKIGGGKYYQASVNGNEVKAFAGEVAKLRKSDKASREMNHYQHLFPYFLGLGLTILVIAYFIPVRRKKG